MRKLLLIFARLSLLLYFAVTATCAVLANDVLNSDKLHSKQSADEFVRQGDSYTSLHKHKEAIQSYTEALILDPQCARAYVGRGRGFARVDDDKSAIQDFDQALKLVPEDAVVLGLRGECKSYSHENRDYSGAIEDYTKSIAIRRDLPYVFVGRAEARIAIHDYSGAIEDCNTILQKMPNDGRLLVARAKAENGLGNYHAAWRDLSFVIKNDLTKADGICATLLILVSLALGFIGMGWSILVLRTGRA
jgi:tetratricopeptide (TPR) repeat protein